MKKAKIISMIFILFTILNISICDNTSKNHLIMKFYSKDTKKDYFEANYKSYIYSQINLGSDNQNVEMRLQLNKYSTYVTIKNKVSPDYTKYTYDNATSKSYEFVAYIPSFSGEDFYSSSISNEKLKINDDKVIDKFLFAYADQLDYSLPDIPSGSIGFDIYQQFQQFNIGFLDQLKKNNLISNYGITFNFTSRNEGNLIIGPDFDELPGNENKYKKSDIYIKIDYSPRWELGFSSVNVGEKTLENSKDAKIELDSEFFLGTDEYSDMIYNNFFSTEKKCTIEKIEQKENFGLVKCEKDIKFDNFPELTFYFNSPNSTILNFTHSDLFELQGDYYYFKILIVQKKDPTISVNVVWSFGKVFFRKYIVTLNKDKRIMSFFEKLDGSQNDDGNKDNNNGSSINSLHIILIIGLVCICIILFFVIYKFLQQNKKLENKKRKNVLLDEDDDFIDFTKTEKLTESTG